MLTRKPVKGERLLYRSNDPRFDNRIFVVTATPQGDDSLCWIRPESGGDANPFIWTFHDVPLNVNFTILDEKCAEDMR
jgi:hypothetical protein